MSFTPIVSTIVSNEVVESLSQGICGEQNIIVGGIANNTTINLFGSQYVLFDGRTNGTIINQFGYQCVFSGGEADWTSIKLFGSQYISSGGTANYTSNSGGTQTIFSGGTATSTTMYHAAQVISGGTVNITTIYGGSQDVFSGGMVTKTNITYGASQAVYFGGSVTSTTINSGCTQTIFSGGSATSTAINWGGVQTIFSGGSATSTAINSGGVQTISSGGSATSTAINSGGVQTIFSGGSATSTAINSGGVQTIFSGGNLSGILTIAGGHVVLADASAANSLASIRYELENSKTNDILLTINSSALVSSNTDYSLDLDNTKSGTYILVNGFDLSSLNNKSFLVTHNNQSVNLQVGVYYTFDDSDKISLNFTDGATDQLTATFIVDQIPPTMPTNLNQAITGNNVTFDWNDSTDAGGIKQYEVQLDYNLDFTIPRYITATSNNANISGLSNGNYYWRMRSQDNSGNYSDWAAGSSFTVDITAPTVPATLTRTVNGSSVALDWADAADATSGVKQYDVQVDNNSNFSTPEYSASPVASNATASNLADGTYYWRVRTQDNSGNYSTWSSGSNFIVDTTAPTVPSTLSRTVNGSSVALDWADATDATSGVKQYEFQVDNNSNFSSNEKSGNTATSNTNATGLTDGSYYWRVRTVDNSGNYSNWTTGSSFTVDITAPTAPSTLTRNVTGNSIALDWADATDATSGVKQYELQVDNNSDFLSNEKSGTAVVSNASVSSITDGNYYWRVRTVDNFGNYSGWSQGSSFTVDISAPSVPASLTPIVTGNNVALDWADSTDAPSGIKQYQVQLDKHADFSSPEYSATPVTSNANATGLTDGNYYWRVNTQDNAGNTSTWSNGTSFVSDVGGTISGAFLLSSPSTTGWVGLNDPADYYKLVMANNGTLNLNLTGLSGDANLSLMDSKGKILKTSAAKGNANENINNLLLTSGTYYVNVAPVKGVNSAAYTLTHAETYFPADTVGNTLATAGVLETNGSADEWVGFGDPADYYKLTLDSAGTLSLNLTGLSGDVNMTLYDAKGKSLKSSSVKGLADENIANLSLAGGDYYVKVAPASGVFDASYKLSNTVDYFPTDTVGNTQTNARILDVNGFSDEWVGFGDPADYYKLTLDSAGKLSLNLADLTGDVNMTLYDAKGKSLKSSSLKGLADENIANLSLLKGDYYVKVAPASGVTDAAYSLSNTVDYFPADTAGNTFALAQPITESGPVNEWLGFGDKDDYYMFELQASTAVTLDLTDMTSNVNLYLYDSKNKQLAASAKSGNTDESITKTLAAGKYYVKATLVGKDNTDYSLNFGIDPDAFKVGSLKLSSAASPLSGSTDTGLTGDPLKKNNGLLAS